MNNDWRNALLSGRIDVLNALLNAGAEVDSRDKYGQTGLMIAARHGKLEVVRFLVQHGAQLNHTAKFGLSALMLAVINNHAEIVRILVDAGAALDIRGTGAPGFTGKTALDLAEARGAIDIVAALRRGFDGL